GFTMDFASRLVLTIDQGGPISVLSGVHVRSLELFAGDHIPTISDPKGKSVGLHLRGRPPAFLGAAAATIGIDPRQDIRAHIDRRDYVLRSLRGIAYDRWREYDPEDTLRFYALRLYEAGLVKSRPNKIIANAADWRFLNELKRELKA